MALSLIPGEKLIAATHNPGKAKEIAALLNNRFEVVTAQSLNLPEPAETEVSFIGNALLKARMAAMTAGIVAIADDSGLCIDALGGDPGIFSARWAGPHRDFDRAMEVIEHKMRIAQREQGVAFTWNAQFVCALAVAWPQGHGCVFEGRIDGRIIFPKSGRNGFGYDPIFQPDGYKSTFGEMTAEAKDAISHRHIAFEQLRAALL
ncbi:MAG: RdgB/HAM1 family non-canonical purine NTP pyrophosphatase [Asticcacaulis sp.]